MCALNNYEKIKDPSGNITGIHIEVHVCDGSGKFISLAEYPLTASEMKTVLADETQLTPIIEQQAAIARAAWQAQLATALQSPVAADAKTLQSFVLSETNIASNLTQITASTKPPTVL